MLVSVILNNGVTNIPLYNCSDGDPKVWPGAIGVKHEVYGYLSIVYGILIEILYLPCVAVMRSKKLYQYSCFKLMFSMGLFDMAAVLINSIAYGYFLVQGAVFCDYPNSMFLLGSFGLSAWCGTCVVCLALVFNRLLDVSGLLPSIYDNMFSSRGCHLINLTAVVYAIYFFLFTRPVLFNSFYGAWFFDPFIYSSRTAEYNNNMHAINNLVVVGLSCFIYAGFAIALGQRFKEAFSVVQNQRSQHHQIFIQITIICSITFVCSIIYVAMQVIPVPHIVIIIANLGWQVAQGSPAVVYLLMNKTIRNAVIRMVVKREYGVHTSKIGPTSDTKHRSKIVSDSRGD